MVARSLPKIALTLVKRSPVSCMPSPESPAKRMTTRSKAWSGCSAVSVTYAPDWLYRRFSLLACCRFLRRCLRHGDAGVEEDVLHRVQQLHPVLARPLERLATHAQPGPAGSLVDHRRADGLAEVSLALGLASRVDERHPPP